MAFCSRDYKQVLFLGKGCALDIPLKNSGIWKPEVRSEKPEFQGSENRD
jgi:hypothetical protein